MKRLAVGSMTTLEFGEWRSKRTNDNILELNSEGVRPMEEYLQVIPSELEIIKQDFEKRNLELERKIERLEEEKVHLRLDADALEIQNHQEERKARIVELKISLALYRSRNSLVELKASLCKIEEMKKRIEELEYALQSCGQRIEFLEGNEERWKEQLYHSQNQIQNRDYIMGRAVAQIREVADHLQTMAMQATILSVKYELKSDRGQELASLLKEVKTLSIKAKPYL
ncbi:hypothetical protein Gogos_020969 [Gossypium gossypioides]|uniref:Uncharacterized protein n=1 Tax=Gossypium gossypioides TaxID=34282 RepID=A0A7J9D4K4_GOSGO|nr:hypothetical protein [Gossypium gossypioides]